jgi:cyanophycin synthetase
MLSDLTLHILGGPNRWTSRTVLEIRAGGNGGASRGLLAAAPAGHLDQWLRQRRLVEADAAALSSLNWPRQLAQLIAALRSSVGLEPAEFFFAADGKAVAFASHDRSLGHLCIDAAAALCQTAEMARGDNVAALENVLAAFHGHVMDLGFDLPVRQLARALDRLGIAHHRHALLDGHYLIGEGRNQIVLDASDTNRTAAMAKDIAGNKDLANALLGAYGFPVARQESVDSPAEAWRCAQELGLPAVIKPRLGGQGKGVTLDVRTRQQAAAAFAAAREINNDVLVESTLPGDDHRIMVVGDGVIALKREPPSVAGDGIHSIAQLIERENAARAAVRGNLRVIEASAETERLLAALDRSLETVLEPGQTQPLQMVPNGSWPRRDVSASIHPENRRMLIDAARLVGLDVASMDFLTPDISRSWRDVGGGICEVESRSGLWALVRAEGEVVDAFARHLTAGRALRIPHVVAVGRDGAVLAAWASELAARLVAQRGWSCGVFTGASLEVGGRQLPADPLSAAAAWLAIVEHPQTDAGIYVVTPETCINDGLGVERPDIVLIADDDGAGSMARIAAAAGAAVLPWQRRGEVEALIERLDPVPSRAD